jgi:hypothetical protein
MRVEQSDAQHASIRRRVIYLGKTTTRSDFDPKKFAAEIIERRGIKMTLAQRQARQAAMEAAVARD